MKIRYTQKGQSLDPKHVARMRAILEAEGIDAVARDAGIAVQTVARVVAGLSVQRGTIVSVETWLARRGESK